MRLADVEQTIVIKDPCFEPHNLFRAIKRLDDRFVWIGNKSHDPGVLHFRFQSGIEAFTASFVNFAPQLELALLRRRIRGIGREWSSYRKNWPPWSA